MTRLNADDARCEALFASGLQRSDAPTAASAADAIRPWYVSPSRQIKTRRYP
jgi:hypothetical protein